MYETRLAGLSLDRRRFRTDAALGGINSVSAKDFLQKLSEAHGVSGYEQAIREMVIAEFKPYADEITVTPMGSVIALKRGAGKGKVLIEGHMDEIGLMVTDVEKGFIRFTQVGGFDVRVLLSQEVIVHGKQELRGIIGAQFLFSRAFALPPVCRSSSD